MEIQVKCNDYSKGKYTQVSGSGEHPYTCG